jgi:hypothetical protein
MLAAGDPPENLIVPYTFPTDQLVGFGAEKWTQSGGSEGLLSMKYAPYPITEAVTADTHTGTPAPKTI